MLCLGSIRYFLRYIKWKKIPDPMFAFLSVRYIRQDTPNSKKKQLTIILPIGCMSIGVNTNELYRIRFMSLSRVKLEGGQTGDDLVR